MHELPQRDNTNPLHAQAPSYLTSRNTYLAYPFRILFPVRHLRLNLFVQCPFKISSVKHVVQSKVTGRVNV